MSTRKAELIIEANYPEFKEHTVRDATAALAGIAVSVCVKNLFEYGRSAAPITPGDHIRRAAKELTIIGVGAAAGWTISYCDRYKNWCEGLTDLREMCYTTLRDLDEIEVTPLCNN